MASDQAFDMTADPDEFVEAVAEFSKRRIITRDEADKLEDYAKRRAWWISGVAQMDVVNDVHESILDALRKGTPFEEWQKQIGPKLEKAWGRKVSARILTIFRNATTQAYNAGRWQQMNEPHVAAARPFVEYDVVNDERTTEHICRPLVGVIVPLDSAFLRTHNPPLHHRCRTGLRTLRRRVAERKGITKDLPDVDATPGFGSPPDIAEPPKPSERETPPDPALALENAVKAGKDIKKRRPVQVKIDPKHTPEYWEEHYREKYGEAARQVGYGRAIHERAKNIPWNDAIESAKAFKEQGIPGFDDDTVQVLTIANKYAENGHPVPSFANDKAEQARLLIAHSRLLSFERSESLPIQALTHRASAERLAAAAKWYQTFSSSLIDVPKVAWTVHNDPDWRAYIYASRLDAHLGISERTHVWVHEWGHAIELRSSSTVRKVAAFRRARERDSQIEQLAIATGIPDYSPSEVTRRDKYWDPYVGKVYAADDDLTEVLSTLFGDLADDLKLGKVYANDPESLYFGLGILAGY